MDSLKITNKTKKSRDLSSLDLCRVNKQKTQVSPPRDGGCFAQLLNGSKQILFKDCSDGERKYFIFYVTKFKLIAVKKEVFKSYDSGVIKFGHQLFKFSVGTRQLQTELLKTISIPCLTVTTCNVCRLALCICGEYYGESLSLEGFKNFWNTITSLYSMGDFWAQQSDNVKHIMLDLFTLGSRVFDDKSYSSPSNILLILVDLMTLFMRGHSLQKAWHGQSFFVYGVLRTLGIKEEVIRVLRDYSVMSNYKFMDDVNGFFAIIESVLDCLSNVLTHYSPCLASWIKDKLLNGVLYSKWMFSYNIKKLVDEYRSNRDQILDAAFRQQVVKEYKNYQKNTPSIIDWSKKSPSFGAILQDYIRLYRIVTTYEESSRVEPSCFIFEGPPGVMKSVVMNKLIRVIGQSSYAHSTKSIDTGKDWYDSYNNEDIFYMDDVGAQGVSQWRNIINFVSPVKMPLDCASADLKDTKYFSSNKIMITTNAFSTISGVTKSDGIGDIHALWRRGYVFDFSRVERKHNFISGQMLFKHYNPKNRSWSNTFPKEFEDYIKERELDIPSTLDFEEEGPLLEWMYAIVTIFERVKKKHMKNNELTEEMAVSIRDRVDNFLGESDIPWQLSNFISSVFEDISSTLTEFVLKHVGSQTSILKTCMIMGPISLVGWFLYKFLMSFKKESIDYGDSKENKDIPYIKDVHPSIKVVQKALKHCEFIKYEGGNKLVTYSVGLVSNRFILTTAHSSVGDKCYVNVLGPNNQRYVDHLEVTKVFIDMEMDLVIYALPSNYPTPFKDISKYIGNMDDTSLPASFLLTPDGVCDIRKFPGKPVTVPTPYEFKIKDKIFTNIIGPGDIFYDFHSPGWCGSLVVNNRGKILGHHVAGSNKANSGVALRWSSHFCIAVQDSIQPTGQTLNLNISDKELPNFSGIKFTQKDYVSHSPKHTHFEPSEMYGVFPIERQPSNLSVYGAHTVKDVGKKSFKHVKDVDEHELDFADDVLDHLLYDFDMLSIRETIQGGDLMARINKKSSNGYGFLKDKDTYLDYNVGKIKEPYNEEYDQYVDKVKNGQLEVKDMIWTETLKDELRGLEKKEPRSFRVSNLYSQILTKSIFGNMVKQIVRDRKFNQIMIGVNPYVEWDDLYRDLVSKHKVWAGDIGNWDGNMLPQVQQRLNKLLVKKFKGDKDLCFNILSTISSTLVLMNDDLFLTTHSMPSGSFLTAIYNSLVNRYYTAMWFYRYTKNSIKRENMLSVFFSEITDYVYGDDKVNGLKTNTYVDVLNALTMKEFFESIGMRFTDSKKNDIKKEFQDLVEITFLKREFKWHPIIKSIVGPLDLKTICSSIQFVDTSKDLSTVLSDKLHSFQREAFLHSSLYQELVDKIEQWTTTHNIPFVRLPQEYLLKLYKEGAYNVEEEKYGLIIQTIN